MFEEIFAGDVKAVLAIVAVMVIPVCLFYFIYKVVDSCNRRKTDMILARQGIQPVEADKGKCRSSLIVWAFSLVGLGAGIWAGFGLFQNEVTSLAVTVILLGGGMLGGYFVARAADSGRGCSK